MISGPDRPDIGARYQFHIIARETGKTQLERKLNVSRREDKIKTNVTENRYVQY